MTVLGFKPAAPSFLNLTVYREKTLGNGFVGISTSSGVFMRLESEGPDPCTHLRVEWKFHVGFLSEAELGEVIENCQEMVIWCHCVFITDTQL